MKTTLKLTAALMMMALLATTSVFAESRHQRETRSYNRNSRVVSVEGRIRDIDRQRNRFVIRLDRGNYLLIADANTDVYNGSRRGRTRVRQLERGDFIRATGELDSRRAIDVESISLLREEDDRWDRNDRSVRGIVQSVDVGRRIVWLREDRSNRVIAVDVRDADRADFRWDGRRDERWNDLRQIRPGDHFTASGDWRSNGSFEAERFNFSTNNRW